MIPIYQYFIWLKFNDTMYYKNGKPLQRFQSRFCINLLYGIFSQYLKQIFVHYDMTFIWLEFCDSKETVLYIIIHFYQLVICWDIDLFNRDRLEIVMQLLLSLIYSLLHPQIDTNKHISTIYLLFGNINILDLTIAILHF